MDSVLCAEQEDLRCPTTLQELQLLPLAEAVGRLGFAPTALRTNGIRKARPFGATEMVLVRADNQAAYPVVDGVPILLAPELLGRQEDAGPFDLDQPAFEEAYLEMDFYNGLGTAEAADVVGSDGWKIIEGLVRAINGASGVSGAFLDPPHVWLDAVYDVAAQLDAYRTMQPLEGGCFAQVGGKGISAVKFLIGGAARAWLVTPMLGEARCALALAAHYGVQDRFRVVVAVAEQMPLRSDMFDGIYIGGSAHHMDMALAMPEMMRILQVGRAVAAVEPYRAPFYGVGTKLLGKREPNAYCSPLDESRIAPFLATFADGEVVHHGTFSRYPLLALSKAKINVPLRSVSRIMAIDDRLCRGVPRLRRAGSSVALVGRKVDSSGESVRS